MIAPVQWMYIWWVCNTCKPYEWYFNPNYITYVLTLVFAWLSSYLFSDIMYQSMAGKTNKKIVYGMIFIFFLLIPYVVVSNIVELFYPLIQQ